MRVLINEWAGYMGSQVFEVDNVYLKSFKFGEVTIRIPVCFIGDTPFILSNMKKLAPDIDFFAVSQAPLIPYGDTYIEIDWDEGLKRYKENLKKVIRR